MGWIETYETPARKVHPVLIFHGIRHGINLENRYGIYGRFTRQRSLSPGIDTAAELPFGSGSRASRRRGRYASCTSHYFLLHTHITQGNPCPFLPMPRSKSASRIFRQRDRGFVLARMDSRVTGPDGGTNAGDIQRHSVCQTITFRAFIIDSMTGTVA